MYTKRKRKKATGAGDDRVMISLRQGDDWQGMAGKEGSVIYAYSQELFGREI